MRRPAAAQPGMARNVRMRPAAGAGALGQQPIPLPVVIPAAVNVRMRPAAHVAPPAQQPQPQPGEAPGAHAPQPAQQPQAQPGEAPVAIPGQRANARQYCWWITFAHPYQETAERLHLKTPSEFTRATFLDVVINVYSAVGLSLTEAAVFLEPHKRVDDAGNRLMHLNCLTRCSGQHTWPSLARTFREQGIAVDFAAHIKTWYDGVVYGTVPSDHKPIADIDADPLQWARPPVVPTPFREVLPPKWRGWGRRAGKLSHLQMYDIFLQKGVTDEDGAWTLAAEMASVGERGLMSSLLELKDVGSFIAKVTAAKDAKVRARRREVGRLGLLVEATNTNCVCTPSGRWKELAVDTLGKNNCRGLFCAAMYKALLEGRKKGNNVFLLGPTNAGKSFLVKPLSLIYNVYTIPDGGSYQLESILDKELVFLNDFEWDTKETWMRWSYFKDFLEGSAMTVARPKNRGGNVPFDRDLPVIGTAAGPIQYLVRAGRASVVHVGETQQMDSRIVYIWLRSPGGEVVECPPCSRCAAELYMAGKPAA